MYLGHLPNDFCVTSPTKLLHFPNNLSHFPNNLCHFPNTFSHFPNNFVSLCPPPKIMICLKKNLGFHILISLHHFKKKAKPFFEDLDMLVSSVCLFLFSWEQQFINGALIYVNKKQKSVFRAFTNRKPIRWYHLIMKSFTLGYRS